MEYKDKKVDCELQLTPLTKKHYEQYKRIVADCYYEMRKALNIRPYDNHHMSLDDFIELEKTTFLLLKDDEIIGALTCSDDYIKTVVVNIKYQGRGFGRKIMKFAINHMQQKEISPIKLIVAQWNKNAISLYKSLGFEIVKETIGAGYNTKNDADDWEFEFVNLDSLNVR